MYNYEPVDIGMTLAGRKSGKTILGLTEADAKVCPFIPQTDPDYVPQPFMVDVVIALREKMPVYLYGSTGTGKTHAVKYLASKFRLPVFEVTGHNRLEFPELVGGYHVASGDMVWHDGPLTSAMRNGGIFLLNEQSLLDPSTATGLNSVLDGSPLFIPETGEAVPPHPAFLYVATDNSNGTGDTSGGYAGVLRQNSALLNRFMLIQATYLERAAEKKFLQAAEPSLPEDILDKMLDMATSVREGVNPPMTAHNSVQATLPESAVMSMRDLKRWARLTMIYAPAASEGVVPTFKALQMAYLNRLDAGARDAAEGMFERIFGVQIRASVETGKD